MDRLARYRSWDDTHLQAKGNSTGSPRQHISIFCTSLHHSKIRISRPLVATQHHIWCSQNCWSHGST
jgi:hypothetical protein